MTKFRFIASLLVAVIFSATVATTAFAGRQDFTLVNYTGRDIVNIYIAPSNTFYWDDDILDVGVLYNMDSVHIHFSRKERDRYWDMMATFSDGNTWIWEDIDLFSVSTIALRFDGAAIEY